jgi:hypothetical protein
MVSSVDTKRSDITKNFKRTIYIIYTQTNKINHTVFQMTDTESLYKIQISKL